MGDQSRLFVSELRGMRCVRMASGAERWLPDASWIPFLLEEAISFGAGKVAVDSRDIPDRLALPASLRRRVDTCKITPHARRALAFLSPVATAIGHRPTGGYYIVRPGTDVDAYLRVYRGLTSWLLARGEKLHVPLESRAMLKAIGRLKRACSADRECTVRLSAIEGVLRGYKRTETSALIVVHTVRHRLHELLEELMDDAAFHDLGEGALELGWSDKIAAAKRRIARAAKAIVKNRVFKGALRLGNREILARAGMDVGGLFETEQDDMAGYAPCIPDVRKSVNAALRRWCLAHPPFVPLQRIPEDKIEEVYHAFTLDDGHRSAMMGFGPPPAGGETRE